MQIIDRYSFIVGVSSVLVEVNVSYSLEAMHPGYYNNLLIAINYYAKYGQIIMLPSFFRQLGFSIFLAHNNERRILIMAQKYKHTRLRVCSWHYTK